MSWRGDILRRKKQELEDTLKEEQVRERKRARAQESRLRVRLGVLAMHVLAHDKELCWRFREEARSYFTCQAAREDLGLDQKHTWFDELAARTRSESDTTQPFAAKTSEPQSEDAARPTKGRSLPPLVLSEQATAARSALGGSPTEGSSVGT